MTYKEFTKWCEGNGYNVSYSEDGIYVSTGIVVSRLGYVSKERSNSMHATSYEQVAYDLFSKMVELASTPLEEREEIKKYYVKIRQGEHGALALLSSSGAIHHFAGDAKTDIDEMYQLTEEQIKAIDPRFMAFAEEVE